MTDTKDRSVIKRISCASVQEVGTTFRSSHGHALERKGHLAVATASNNACRIAHDFLITEEPS